MVPVDPAGLKVWQPAQPADLKVAAASVAPPDEGGGAFASFFCWAIHLFQSAGFITMTMLRIWAWPMPHSSAQTIV